MHWQDPRVSAYAVEAADSVSGVTVNWAYFTALAATSLALPWTGLSWRFPAFHAFLCLQTIGSMIWLVSSDYDTLATRYGWAPIEAISLLAAVIAGSEIIGAMEHAGVRTGIQQTLATALSAGLAAWLAGDTPYRLFLTIREVTWIWLFLSVAGALTFAWLKPVELDPLLWRHAGLFAILMGAHAFIAPILTWGGAPTWTSAQTLYRGVAIGCLAGWGWTREKT